MPEDIMQKIKESVKEADEGNADDYKVADLLKLDEAAERQSPEDNDKDEKREEKKERDEPLIRAHDLDFVYNPGRNNEFHALKKISFDIYPEEFIIIFGPSGCGKSTLLNVIAGLETPDFGSLYVFDRDLTKMSPKDFAMYHRTQVGMIYQAYNLITSLTVLENVALPQLFINVSKRKREKKSRELLDRFGILSHEKKIPTELSGGQQQRIGIARAIVNDPQIILADEPVGNLDSSSANLVLGILDDLNSKEKKTIILVTHNPEFLDFAHRILYMKDGEITKEVVNKGRHSKKKDKKKPSIIKEVNELMRAYQGMSPEQINVLIMPFKSKIFANHFISSRNMEETKVFEEAIQKRLGGNITQDEFFAILNKPSDEGGVGFDARTAQNIIDRINSVMKMAYFVYQKAHQRKDVNGVHERITDDEKAYRLQKYLYKTCYEDYYGNLDDEQNLRILNAIRDRITNEIDRNTFYKYLDRPFADDGVGLNAKTAKAFSEELELILILGFGVVSANERRAAMLRKEEELRAAKEAALKEEQEKDEENPEPIDPKEMLSQINQQLQTEVSTVDEVEDEKRDDIVENDIEEIKEIKQKVKEKLASETNKYR